MPDNIDLNKPYNDPSLKIAQVADVKAPEVKEEPVVEPAKKEEEPAEPQTEEQKVPYSRFKKFHDRALEAAEEAAYWRKIAESSRPAETPAVSNELPDYWVELFGDTEASKKAWAAEQRRQQEAARAIEERALETVSKREAEEAERLKENETEIDNQLEALSDKLGRDLTEAEQSSLLDIVDDYTPKGEDGNYLGAIIPFEKAWEIYELKEQAAKAPSRQSRNQVAALSGSQSQGEPDAAIAERNKNFNPLNWDSYKNRL